MDWGDMFEIEVFPVVTVEQGLEMARQAMSSGQASASPSLLDIRVPRG
jgi:hypothetical protein